jgi:hypothetical protein
VALAVATHRPRECPFGSFATQSAGHYGSSHPKADIGSLACFREGPSLCENATRYNRTRNFEPCGHAQSEKTQKSVLCSALRLNQFSFLHRLGRYRKQSASPLTAHRSSWPSCSFTGFFPICVCRRSGA